VENQIDAIERTVNRCSKKAVRVRDEPHNGGSGLVRHDSYIT
jgi:hypothetical protein